MNDNRSMLNDKKSNRLLLFYTVTAFFWFSLYAYVPFVGPFAEELGADLRMVGLIAGAYGFTQMVLRIPLGIFSDMIRKRRVFVLTGAGVAAVAGVVVYFFPNPFTLLTSRALGGVAASAWVTFTVLGASYYPRNETTKSMGLLHMINALGRMAALLAGGFVAMWFGVTYVFLLGGVIGFAALLLGAGIIEKRPEATQAGPSLSSLYQVARNRQLLCTSFLGILIQYIIFATTFGFTPIAAVQLDASQFQLGMLGVASALPGLVFAPMAGTTLPRLFGVKATLSIGFGLTGLGAALIPFCTTLWHIFAIQVIGSIGAVTVLTLLMGLCIVDISSEKRATAMGFFQAVYGLGMFLGPFTMGWFSHTFGLNPSFIMISTIGLIGIIAVVVFGNKGHLKQYG